MLSPIVLFVYNRPHHTIEVLNSLAKNTESKDSELYIYCDGPKDKSDLINVEKIIKVRSICFSENRFLSVKVFESDINKGLANSIIYGVTEVINKYGKVIVLEDDLILSPFFLFYMNNSLNRYEFNLKVGQIAGCNDFALGKKYPETFFTDLSDCLGWATWLNRWDKLILDENVLIEKIEASEIKKYLFNSYDSYDFMKLLHDQKNSLINSWAIRWQATCVINNWLTLYSNLSMINHIASVDATHANFNILPPLQLQKPILNNIEVVVLPEIVEIIREKHLVKEESKQKINVFRLSINFIKKYNFLNFSKSLLRFRKI